jgi:phosphoribosylaminoimidazole-succinocarboxamide synthase
MAQVKLDLGQHLPLVASGKVRELYEVDSKTLLFIATDRISAYDVIMKNVSCRQSGRVNNSLTKFRASLRRVLF